MRKMTAPDYPIVKAGRPRAGLYKHGFYSNKFKPCHSCPKQKDGSCPYFHVIKGLEHMHEHSYDSFGVNRCVPEMRYFENLKKLFREEHQLKEADEPLLDKMCMILVRSGRVEEYLADQGLTQIKKIKDDKTGQVFETEIQNILKKDAYFDDKMFREWLDNLRMSKRSREQIDEDSDLAIVFTKELKIKAKKRAVETLKEIQQELTDKADVKT